MAKDNILHLILGDQLNSRHTWFRCVDPKITYLLMKIRQENDYFRHHIQKIVGFFAAMHSFAAWLSESSHRVRYLRPLRRISADPLSKRICQQRHPHCPDDQQCRRCLPMNN